MADITFTLGDYTFEPAPMISIGRASTRTGDTTLLGHRFTGQMEGVLTGLRRCAPSIDCLMTAAREMEEELRDCTCSRMVIACGESVLLDTYVKIQTLDFHESQNHWVQTIPYSISVEWESPEASGGGSECLTCLTSVEDSWEVQPLEGVYTYVDSCSGLEPPTYFTVSHTVSATGVNCCGVSGAITPGWEVARSWVMDNVGVNAEYAGEAAINFDPSGYDFVDHRRVRSLNRFEGSFSITESWTAISPSGVPHCVEEFVIEKTTSSDNRNTQYSINGTIQGGEVRNSSFVVTKTRIESARECWEEVKPLLSQRLDCFAVSGCPINTVALQTSESYNVTGGIVAYNYAYNDRPPSLIDGALYESISIQDGLATDRITETPIIGRGSPIATACGSNWLTKTISINAVMPKNGACAPSGDICAKLTAIMGVDDSKVSELLCCYETALANVFDQVFITGNDRQFSSDTGVYTRTVVFTLNDCGIVPPTGHCPEEE